MKKVLRILMTVRATQAKSNTMMERFLTPTGNLLLRIRMNLFQSSCHPQTDQKQQSTVVLLQTSKVLREFLTLSKTLRVLS